MILYPVGAVLLFAGGAAVQVDLVSGEKQFLPGAVSGNGGIRPEAQTDKETGHIIAADQTDFPGRMALGLEKQKAENQISEPLVPECGEHADLSEPEGAVLPPEAPGRGRNIILKYQHVPALIVQRVPAAAEYLLSDVQRLCEIAALGKPFTLNHLNPS